jgi:hypothetical protein
MQTVKKQILLVIVLLSNVVLMEGMTRISKVRNIPKTKELYTTKELSSFKEPKEIVFEEKDQVIEEPWLIKALKKWWFKVSFSNEEIEALKQLDEGIEFFGNNPIKELLQQVIDYLEAGEKDELEKFFKVLGFNEDEIASLGFDHNTAKKFKQLLIDMANEPKEIGVWSLER